MLEPAQLAHITWISKWGSVLVSTAEATGVLKQLRQLWRHVARPPAAHQQSHHSSAFVLYARLPRAINTATPFTSNERKLHRSWKLLKADSKDHQALTSYMPSRGVNKHYCRRVREVGKLSQEEDIHHGLQIRCGGAAAWAHEQVFYRTIHRAE